MAAGITSYVVAVLAYLGTSCASADDFAERCKELSQQVEIFVTFQDRPAVIDETRNVQTLNGLSGKRAGDAHNVYGFTHAEPSFRMSVRPRAVIGGHGQFCAIPDISLSLGFSQLVVYLARELTDPCRRNIILQHEEDHVSKWKAHMRASAQLLTSTLRREVGEPRSYASRDEVEAGIRTWADELVKPWVTRILNIVREEQQAIDTPASYAAVADRLRTCPR